MPPTAPLTNPPDIMAVLREYFVYCHTHPELCDTKGDLLPIVDDATGALIDHPENPSILVQSLLPGTYLVINSGWLDLHKRHIQAGLNVPMTPARTMPSPINPRQTVTIPGVPDVHKLMLQMEIMEVVSADAKPVSRLILP